MRFYAVSKVLNSCQDFEKGFVKVCRLNHDGYITANGALHTLWNIDSRINSAPKLGHCKMPLKTANF